MSDKYTEVDTTHSTVPAKANTTSVDVFSSEDLTQKTLDSRGELNVGGKVERENVRDTNRHVADKDQESAKRRAKEQQDFKSDKASNKKRLQLEQRIAERKKRGLPVDQLEKKLASLPVDSAGLQVKGSPIRKPHKANAYNDERIQAIDGLDRITFPESLPISAKRQEIADLITGHQVLILAGETGSGKTTQLPKLCLTLGLGRKGRIGHTQPRRIAARSVATRIAHELKVELGKEVGYQVRFTDRTAPSTLIKLMTDGVLLAEIQSDPLLERYDTLIIDEAHERSINIDFLLGYLKELLPKRPDLKLIVTSATIDLAKFSKHFGDAPIIEVSGRNYPVELRYQEIGDGAEDEDQADTQRDGLLAEVRRVCDELIAEAKGQQGDILVFLTGERDIRQCADELKKMKHRAVEVLPLYSRLSADQQNKIFSSGGLRKIILATNVAETSLTVPGIRFVIDSGLARIKRYSVRSKIERLPIEEISKASARQRSGRCGRMQDGICVRLYSEENFNARAEFTEPEIQRSNLASVILQMQSFGVRDPEHFPFIDPPEKRLLNDGFRLLQELKAHKRDRTVTTIGRSLQKLKVDPSLGRILLEAGKRGVLSDALIIVSGIASQDPRERPHGKRDAADLAHKRFDDKRSDLNSFIYLWDYLAGIQQGSSRRQFDQQCRSEFLHPLRIREWRELHRELQDQCKQQGLKLNQRVATVLPYNDAAQKSDSPSDPSFKQRHRLDKRAQDKPSPNDTFLKAYPDLHKSLLSGFITQCGLKVEVEKKANTAKPGPTGHRSRTRKTTEYEGTRQRRFQIFPASSLAKLRPKWIVAGQLLETSALYAHSVAAIENSWIEEMAGHLLKETLFEPSYDHKRGQVFAFAKLSLYGLIVNERKRVNFAERDSSESRQIFIREALVHQFLEKHQHYLNRSKKLPAFYHNNKKLLNEIAEEEAKHRRRDIQISDDALLELYASHIPTSVVDKPSFDKWYTDNREAADAELKFTKDQLRSLDQSLDDRGFPSHIHFGELVLPVTYEFNPGGKEDGVNVTLPLSYLHTINPIYGEWLVPGFLEDKVLALLKSLPKAIRRKLVPLPNSVASLLPRLSQRPLSLTSVLAEEVSNHLALPLHNRLSADDFDESTLPGVLKINYRLTDDAGKLLASDRDLAQLKARFKQKVRDSIEAVSGQDKITDIKRWDFGDLPTQTELKKGAIRIKAYPALTVDTAQNSKSAETQVALKMLDDQALADHKSFYGQLELAYKMLEREHKPLRQKLLRGKDSPLSVLSIGNRQELVKSIILAACWQSVILCEDRGNSWAQGAGEYRAFVARRPLFRDEASFNAAVKSGAASLAQQCLQYEKILLELFPLVLAIQKALKKQNNALALAMSIGEMHMQQRALLYPGFLLDVPIKVVESYPRYLNAMLARLEKAAQNPSRERVQRLSLARLWQRHEERFTSHGASRFFADPFWQAYRWGIEELRVSFYAQQYKTLVPISEKRLDKLWAEIDQ